MKNNNLLSVRSNCTFALDYKKGTLHPSTEIILITSSPKYVMSKEGDSFKKDQEVSEYRFITSLDGVNQLIGELQLVAKNIMDFQQLSGSLNKIIEASRENEIKE